MIIILFYSCLFLDEEIQAKFVWIQKMIKVYEKGTLKKEFCMLSGLRLD